jgi:hypothetical protein
LLYGVLGSFWALGGAGFPFGGAHDDTVLATSRAATAGPVMATVGLAGGVLALVMAQGRGRGPARSALIGVGAVMAVTPTVVIPDYRPLMALARTPLVSSAPRLAGHPSSASGSSSPACIHDR